MCDSWNKSVYTFGILGPMRLHLWGKSVYSKAIILEVNISDKTCSHARAIKRHKQIRRSWLIISVSLQMVHEKAYTFKDTWKSCKVCSRKCKCPFFSSSAGKIILFFFVHLKCVFIRLSELPVTTCLSSQSWSKSLSASEQRRTAKHSLV